MSFDLLLASPRGFCAGVDRAIEIVELALELYGKPVYVRHEIVHNRHVVDDLRAKGAIFTDDLAEVPEGSLVVFSAHGISPAVRAEAERRKLRTLDATCPLVTKVHVEAMRYARDGYEIVLVGHRGHVEVDGTLGHAPERMHLVETVEDVAKLAVRDESRLSVLTQTTLSVDDTAEIVAVLRRRFPQLATPRKEDICYATQNRQDAVKTLLENCDVLIVVGSATSSNSNRLRELADRLGMPGYLVDGPDELHREWFEGKKSIGVTAGASAPELLVQQVIERLRSWGADAPQELFGREERVIFGLPRELRRADS